MTSTQPPRVVSLGEAIVDLIGIRDGESGGMAYRPHPGGSPLNAAVAAARLDTPTAFLTRISDDGFGALLRAHLQAAGVDLGLTESGPEPTGLAVVSVDADGRAAYGFYRAETADVSYDPRPRPTLPGSVVVGNVTVSLLRPPARDAFREIVAASGRTQGRAVGDGPVGDGPVGDGPGGDGPGERRGRITWVVDPNARPALWPDADAFRREVADWATLADVVKTSDEDLVALGADGSAAAEASIAAGWLAVGVEAVVVTLGPDGARLHRLGRPVLAVPGRRVEVVDTVGAGDTFTAALTTGLVDLAAPRELDDDAWIGLLQRAVVASSITCTRAGADPPTAAELAAVLGS
jgi:fructokinase